MTHALLLLLAALHFQAPAHGSAGEAVLGADTSSSGSAISSKIDGSSGSVASGSSKRVSDAEIKKQIIRDSIDSYPGNCACPYQRASNGSSCGRRSAYSRDNGYAPLCYPHDVTPEMVEAYREEHGV